MTQTWERHGTATLSHNYKLMFIGSRSLRLMKFPIKLSLGCERSRGGGIWGGKWKLCSLMYIIIGDISGCIIKIHWIIISHNDQAPPFFLSITHRVSINTADKCLKACKCLLKALAAALDLHTLCVIFRQIEKFIYTLSQRALQKH